MQPLLRLPPCWHPHAPPQHQGCRRLHPLLQLALHMEAVWLQGLLRHGWKARSTGRHRLAPCCLRSCAPGPRLGPHHLQLRLRQRVGLPRRAGEGPAQKFRPPPPLPPRGSARWWPPGPPAAAAHGSTAHPAPPGSPAGRAAGPPARPPTPCTLRPCWAAGVVGVREWAEWQQWAAIDPARVRGCKVADCGHSSSAVQCSAVGSPPVGVLPAPSSTHR